MHLWFHSLIRFCLATLFHGIAWAQVSGPAAPVEDPSSVFMLDAFRVHAILDLASDAELGRRGQARNPKLAARLYCKAARYGSLEAQYRLGRMFLSGKGVPKSVPVAATLFSIAATSGHEKAGGMLQLTGPQPEKLPSCLAEKDEGAARQGMPPAPIRAGKMRLT